MCMCVYYIYVISHSASKQHDFRTFVGLDMCQQKAPNGLFLLAEVRDGQGGSVYYNTKQKHAHYSLHTLQMGLNEMLW